MTGLETERLRISPFTWPDFALFVENMLTDPRVVKFYHSYRDLSDPEIIRRKAESDFWEEFEMGRKKYGLPV